jgi:mono/diheme cytochrome c family protein
VRAARALAAGVVLAATLTLGASWWRSRNIGPVQRGFAAAEQRGCFGCHGPGGLPGFEGAAAIGGVPALGGDSQVRTPTEAEIREWILDGRPARMAGEAEASDEDDSLLRMPAFRSVLKARELDDIVAYVKAIGGVDLPAGGPVLEGHEAAARLGCFQCHGPGGRGDTPNPGSLKGYIPSWSGADFPELAADDDEVRAWILDASPRRLRDHPVARFFLERQVVRMPAYRGRITDAEVDSVIAYIRWLRRS